MVKQILNRRAICADAIYRPDISNQHENLCFRNETSSFRLDQFDESFFAMFFVDFPRQDSRMKAMLVRGKNGCERGC